MENMKEIQLSQIVPSKLNSRKSFDDIKMKELTASIKEKGVIEPIIVRSIRKLTEDMDEGVKRGVDNKLTYVKSFKDMYEIVCGERRYRAAKAAGLETISSIIKVLTDAEASELRIVENLQREDINAMDEAAGIAALLKDKNDPKAVASKLGKSEGFVTARMRLLKLPKEVQAAISSDKISPAHGLVIARLTDIGDQKQLLDMIIDNKLSVRATENELNQMGIYLSGAPFKTDECGKCPHNGSTIKDLFDEDTNLKGKCLNNECYTRKQKEWFDKKRADIVKQGSTLMTENEVNSKVGHGWKYNRNASQTFQANDKKDLGKKYKEKCQHCNNHMFVAIEDHKGTSIEERCFNPRCMNGTSSVGANVLKERADQRNETKTENRCRTVLVPIWRQFSEEHLGQHGINVLICKEIHENIMGVKMTDGWKTDIGKLWKKSDAELLKTIKEGLIELIRDQYGTHDLANLSAGLKFNPGKDMHLDDMYWGALSKAELIEQGKQLGLKPGNSADSDFHPDAKRDELIKKVKSAVKPGFVPDDIKKFIAKPS